MFCILNPKTIILNLKQASYLVIAGSKLIIAAQILPELNCVQYKFPILHPKTSNPLTLNPKLLNLEP